MHSKFEDAVSDGNSHRSVGASIASREHSEGQILDGKIRSLSVGRLDPAFHIGIVSFVENRFHKRY